MVLLVTTPPILSAFEAVSSQNRKELDLPESLSLAAPISHDQLIRLARRLRPPSTDESNHGRPGLTSTSLDALLRGTKVYVPPPPPKPEPSPEYLASKARLIAAAEADAYNRLVTNPSTSHSHASPFSSSTPILASMHDTKSSEGHDTEYPDPLTPSLVLNIFLSVLITGFGVYWALTSFPTPELLTTAISSIWRGGVTGRTPGGQGQPRAGAGVSEAVRILVSLLVAVVIGVAEVAIYAIYLHKVDHARAREKKLRERKQVIASEVVSGGVGPQKIETAVDGDQVEIWGRGANGGLRRRVREKWEEQERESPESPKNPENTT